MGDFKDCKQLEAFLTEELCVKVNERLGARSCYMLPLTEFDLDQLRGRTDFDNLGEAYRLRAGIQGRIQLLCDMDDEYNAEMRFGCKKESLFFKYDCTTLYDQVRCFNLLESLRQMDHMFSDVLMTMDNAEKIRKLSMINLAQINETLSKVDYFLRRFASNSSIDSLENFIQNKIGRFVDALHSIRILTIRLDDGNHIFKLSIEGMCGGINVQIVRGKVTEFTEEMCGNGLESALNIMMPSHFIKDSSKKPENRDFPKMGI